MSNEQSKNDLATLVEELEAILGQLKPGLNDQAKIIDKNTAQTLSKKLQNASVIVNSCGSW